MRKVGTELGAVVREHLRSQEWREEVRERHERDLAEMTDWRFKRFYGFTKAEFVELRDNPEAMERFWLTGNVGQEARLTDEQLRNLVSIDEKIAAERQEKAREAAIRNSAPKSTAEAERRADAELAAYPAFTESKPSKIGDPCHFPVGKQRWDSLEEQAGHCAMCSNYVRSLEAHASWVRRKNAHQAGLQKAKSALVAKYMLINKP